MGLPKILPTWAWKTSWAMSVLAVCSSIGLSQTEPSDPREAAMQLVVRIQANFDGSNEVGGGLIAVVSEELDRVYIVTANHVVRLRNSENTPGKDIKVQFRWSPESFPAELMEGHFDKAADLAVLRVRNIKDLGLPKNLPLAHVGSSAALRHQSKVYTLGFPNGRQWFLSATPDAISSTGSDWVRFQAGFLAPGHSGGALLNEQYQPVGLILEDAPPESKALRLEYILSQLKEWRYNPSLRVPTGPSAPGTTTKRVVRLLYADVVQDGSGGTTRWDMRATADGSQLFDWKNREVNDDRGKNRIKPDEGDAEVEVKASGPVEIEVKGDHSVGQPKPAAGKMTVSKPGQFSIPVKATPAKDGYFNFVFVLEERN